VRLRCDYDVWRAAALELTAGDFRPIARLDAGGQRAGKGIAGTVGRKHGDAVRGRGKAVGHHAITPQRDENDPKPLFLQRPRGGGGVKRLRIEFASRRPTRGGRGILDQLLSFSD